MFRKKKEEEITPMSTNSKSESPNAPRVTAPAAQSSVSTSTSSGTENIEDVIARRFGKPRSALGPGTVIQGKLSFDTTVVIEGKLGGEVYSTETLIVGKLGNIGAQVRVKNLVVAGTVTGNIVAAECIELLRGGRIEGDFTTKRLVIEEGSYFNGSCKMIQDGATATQAQTTVKETDLSADELKRAADLAKNGSLPVDKKPQQPQVRPNGQIGQPATP